MCLRCQTTSGGISREMRHEHSSARHAPNLAAVDLRYEIADRNLHFIRQCLHRGAARLPDPHQREEHDGKQHRHPSAVGKLQQVGGQEGVSTVANPTPIAIAAGSGNPQISRRAIESRKVVSTMSADTAIP
jgi:hypothetical protein